MYIYIYVYTVHAHRNTHTHTGTCIQHILGQIHRPDKCVHVTPRGWQPCRPWNSLWRPSFSVSFLEVTRRGKFCEHTQDRSNVETPLMTFEQFEPFFPTRLGFKFDGKLSMCLQVQEMTKGLSEFLSSESSLSAVAQDVTQDKLQNLISAPNFAVCVTSKPRSD